MSSEKKGETQSPPPTSKTALDIPKEEYWTFVKVVREAVKFVDGTLYPMLERRGVGKETIATMAVLFASAIQETMITQMSIMKTGIEPTISLSEVEKAVEKIYKQYSSGEISPKEAADALFSVIKSLFGKK